MFGFSPKLPVSDEDQRWVDEGFRRLEKLLGRHRMLDAEVVLPAAEYFPDPYDKTPEAAEKLLRRVCAYMRVDHNRIELEIFSDETQELRNLLPAWRGKSGGPAGLYVHDHATDGEGEGNDRRMVVAIRATQLNDPLSLVATVAHELGHVILLGGRLLDSKTQEHEPLTDLLTVFLGLGIFTANSAGRFTQFQEDRRQGWSMHRLGYLPEEVYGYALARFARERGEDKPVWIKHLSTNVRVYFRRSCDWLAKNGPRTITAKPIE